MAIEGLLLHSCNSFARTVFYPPLFSFEPVQLLGPGAIVNSGLRPHKDDAIARLHYGGYRRSCIELLCQTALRNPAILPVELSVPWPSADSSKLRDQIGRSTCVLRRTGETV